MILHTPAIVQGLREFADQPGLNLVRAPYISRVPEHVLRLPGVAQHCRSLTALCNS